LGLTANPHLQIHKVSHRFIMDVLNYNELPNEIKAVFIKKIESEIIESNKMMGLDKPKQWQIDNRVEYESKNYLFHNDHGIYYSLKVEKLSF